MVTGLYKKGRWKQVQQLCWQAGNFERSGKGNGVGLHEDGLA